MEQKKNALLRLRNCSAFHDFAFYHRGEKYYVNTVIISAVSPVVSKLLFLDTPKYSMELPPIEGPMDQFIRLIYGDHVTINCANCRFFNLIARILEISSLMEATNDIILKTNTLDNVIRFAETLLSCNLDASEEIDLIAHNFESVLENPYISLCSANLLKHVIASSEFDVDNKDIVIEFFARIVAENKEKYFPLIEYIFQNVSTDFGMFSAISTLSNTDLNKARNQLQKILLKSNTRPPTQYKSFYPIPGKLSGIIDFVNQSKAQNSVNHYFTIAGTPAIAEEYNISNLLNSNPASYYIGNPAGEQYIEFRLIYKHFIFTHYAFLSCPDSNKGRCPRSWKVEGRCESGIWIEIDQVRDDMQLTYPEQWVVYKLLSGTAPLSAIRFVFTESNQKYNQIALSGIEFFGLNVN